MIQSNIEPVSTRLEGLDLARFIAFVGMVIVNFKIVMGGATGSDFLMTFTGALEGRAAATFVVLAGIGLGLSAQIGEREKMHSVTIRRAIFLLNIGLLNSLIFPADILHYYAFYFFFAALLIPLSSRAIVGVIVLINVIFVLMLFTLDYEAGWDWKSLTYEGFWSPAGFIRNLFFNGWHPVFPWVSFVLIGIIISRFDLSKRTMQWGLLLGGISVVILIELFVGLITPQSGEFAEIITTSPLPPMPFYIIAGTGVAMAVIGGCLLIEPAMRKAGILNVIIPAGRQTLTLYIAHILIGMWILEAMGMMGNQTIDMAVAASFIFCAASVLYAYLWRYAFKRGPIEALMRKVAG